jgi:hypothetical protein
MDGRLQILEKLPGDRSTLEPQDEAGIDIIPWDESRNSIADGSDATRKIFAQGPLNVWIRLRISAPQIQISRSAFPGAC